MKFIYNKEEELTNIYYFTALARWNEAKVQRHKTYIKALESEGIKIIYGNFKKVTKRCRKCNQSYRTFEEKETDVNIALYLLEQGLQEKLNKYFILTADTDLVPAVEMLKKNCPHLESHLIIPTNSRTKTLRDITDKSSKIKIRHLEQSLFPSVVKVGHSNICKPTTW